MRTGNSMFAFELLASAALGLFGLLQASGEPAAKHDAHEEEAVSQGVAVLLPMRDSNVRGVLWLKQGTDGLHIAGAVEGLEPGLHGFHIHEFGDLSDPQGKAAGDHYNPGGHKHGGPDDNEKHAGDLGNIKAGEDGAANVNVKAPGLKLKQVIGRSFVVHAKADDLKSQPSGDAGDRIAVGVIGIANSKSSPLKSAAKQ